MHRSMYVYSHSCGFFLLVFYLTQTFEVSGLVEKFYLVITREILPGFTKKQVTINGTVPGPTLNVTIGNWVEVNIIFSINIIILGFDLNYFKTIGYSH